MLFVGERVGVNVGEYVGEYVGCICDALGIGVGVCAGTDTIHPKTNRTTIAKTLELPKIDFFRKKIIPSLN